MSGRPLPPPEARAAAGTAAANATTVAATVASVLSRPDRERLREHKYRFAQALVFGLPVLALQGFGRSLGGPEAGRWVGGLQAVLTGWVVYVGAAGMLAEGLMRLTGKVAADAAVAVVVTLLYLFSLGAFVAALAGVVPAPRTWFHGCVLLLATWTGLQWWRLARRVAAAGRTEPRAPAPSEPPAR